MRVDEHPDRAGCRHDRNAANRTEPRGAHAREDFPDRDDKEWMKQKLCRADTNNMSIVIDYRPVHNYTLCNEFKYLAPKGQVY